MREAEFKKIVRGERKGGRAALLRFALRAAAALWSPAVRFRNLLYDFHLKKSRRLPVPVVSIGNLTLGGTGKTPMVSRLVHLCRAQGYHPAVLSRGYKSKEFCSSEKPASPFLRMNDEAAELAAEFPDLPHYLSPNRFKAGTALLKAHPETDLIILDDGFQHRRLHRDKNIILLDGLNPFGGGRLFPAGFLREPLSSLRRADAVFLTRADLISEERRREIETAVRKIAPRIFWGEAVQVPESLCRYRENGWEKIPFRKISEISGPWLPFCGLGNPDAFYRMLQNEGVCTKKGISFSDHTSPDETGLSRLQVAGADSAGYLTTMKDLVKLRRSEISGKPVWGVKIELKFLKGDRFFDKDTGQK